MEQIPNKITFDTVQLLETDRVIIGTKSLTDRLCAYTLDQGHLRDQPGKHLNDAMIQTLM